MRVCLMVEGQEDVTWEQWVALARAAEEHGLEGLFRSDHYVSVFGEPNRGSLDAWTTVAALGAVTERIRLGVLVSPVTFRHPSLLAKAVVTPDHVSNGRVELGMGAGWHDLEHRSYGFEFPEGAVRLEMLEEQLELVHRQWSDEVVDFEGRHYRVRGLRALPKPAQDPHPNLIVGGRAGPTSVRLAARWADEYKTILASPGECRRRRGKVARAWERERRDPDTLVFSLMTGCVVGTGRDEVLRRAGRVIEHTGEGGEPEDFVRDRREDWVVGTTAEVVDGLRELQDAGVDRVMLQHLVPDDLDMVALLGREVVPAVA
ncbi:MAG: TIGR03560 family F420-dependent LLM class oxidoreductase [Actinomycetota bacterium]